LNCRGVSTYKSKNAKKVKKITFNLNRNGGSIADAFRLLNDKIYYAHLKNLLKMPNSHMVVTRLEEGHVDQMEVMAGLKAHLRSGMLAIEYPCSGDGIIAAHRDMEYIRFMKKR